VQAIAKWLVARPQNAIPVLGITLLIPVLQPISGIIIVLLVLTHGVAGAFRQATLAAAIFAVALMLSGMPWQNVIMIITVTWVPLFVLGWAMLATRSFTLALQASVIVAVAAGVATGVLIDDAVALWQPVIDAWLKMVGSAAGDAAALRSPEFAENLGAVFVASAWFIYTLLFLAGYLLHSKMKEEVDAFGRIRDLNFGRVLASSLVLMIVLSAVTGSKLFDLAAIVLFATFLLQGWTLMYWTFTERKWPTGVFFAVSIVSVLIGYLSALLMMVGYLDAWFDIRRRLKKT
jgi:hypothetical protein